MATVNLGRIKPVFRGAYSGSTAYVVDDIVTHGNESFICIQAHGAGTQATSVTAYWTKLAAKGTDGTDVGTTITTQGDILYRDGSGLQRLAKGTASQSLVMNSGATAPEWATVAGGKTKKTHWWWDDTQGTIGDASSGTGIGLEIADFDFTAASANPHFILDMSLFLGRNSSGNDSGDTYIVAWIEEGGTLRYPFGFKKTGGFRANATFRALTGDYMLEDTDAGDYSDTNDWGGMRWTYAGVMGNQASADTMPTASANIAVGDTLTFKARVGAGSSGRFYNRTHNQTNSISRSWFKITEIDGTL